MNPITWIYPPFRCPPLTDITVTLAQSASFNAQLSHKDTKIIGQYWKEEKEKRGELFFL